MRVKIGKALMILKMQKVSSNTGKYFLAVFQSVNLGKAQ